MNPKWKKRLGILLRLAISVVLIAWVVQLVSTEQLTEALARADLFYILLILLLANTDRLLMAIKWNILLMVKGIHLPLFRVISSYFRSTFYGNLILPSIGADAIRIYEISRQTRKTEDIISSVVIERALGIVALGLVGLFGLFLFSSRVDSSGWKSLLALIAALALIVAGFVLSLNRRRFAWLQKSLAASRWRMVRKLENVMISYQEYARYPRELFTFFVLTIFEQLFPVFSAYLVSRAIHANVPFTTFLIFVPLIMAIVRLPISFDGFGVREVLFVSMFSLIGLREDHAFLIGFMPPVLARLATALPTLAFFWLDRERPPVAEIETAQSPAPHKLAAEDRGESI